jgi:hypothetical protein
MMPPCHTGEEAYGKKDDVLLVVQKEGTDRFQFQICLVLPVLPESEKATRELLKPGGLSGELPVRTPVPFTL